MREGIEPGVLYLVPTPIGNLGDWSPRARAVVSAVDLVLAEDTREFRVLCTALGIVPAAVWSFHQHNVGQRLPAVLDRLRQGQAVALVADRGMPAVSDPGQELVAAALREGLRVSPLPGPSAAVAAFAASGFPHPFVFWGFLPARGRARAEALSAVAATPWTQVLYEAPHRLERTLADLANLVGEEREVAVVREISKRFEEVWRGSLRAARLHAGGWRGELVLVVAPKSPQGRDVAEPDWDRLLEAVRRATASGQSLRDAVRTVAAEAGVSRRLLYQRAQEDPSVTPPPTSTP
ncbi:MAG: 16S rRNA (cytidine(1402)-2'-O)-methyltransferase [Firmicutes bacterium]|nr:16S rRNA (cytidine(1402)-2'-O)-methyltransferase [Alicyclobacillaceae bacterium]MCL6497234.1 16S rRNA (cytidine(1402)-2'-O)-methyltransferase [Bacillota bacterium]